MKPHTKEQGIEAMNNLISQTGLTASNFYFLEDWEAREYELEEGTHCIVTNDDFITAFDHWENYLWAHDEKEQDAYIDFMLTQNP